MGGKTVYCTYSVIAGEAFVPATEAVKPAVGKKLGAIPDGTSNTIGIIEVKMPFCWMDPKADIGMAELAKGINKTGRVGSVHEGGVHIGMLDGSVRFVPQTTDVNILQALADVDDGVDVSLP